MSTILFTEDAWMNSHLSIARHYGQIAVNGKTFIIVNQEGRDIFELSAEAEKEGREKAIPPGEPVDLIDKDYQPIYRKAGREKFLQMLQQNLTLKQMKTEILK